MILQKRKEHRTMKVYLASPFFNDGQRAVKARVKAHLIKCGYEVIDPQEVEEEEKKRNRDIPNYRWGLKTFCKDVLKIKSCDFIVAIDWGLYGDCGTAWEIGYGYAKGLGILVLAPDQTTTFSHSLMVANGSDNFITVGEFLKHFDLERMANSFTVEFNKTIEQK
jgi:nucleoside 2-deoxyribosyltransferase